MKLEHLTPYDGSQGKEADDDLEEDEDREDDAACQVEGELKRKSAHSNGKGEDKKEGDGQLWDKREEPKASKLRDFLLEVTNEA